MSLRIMGAIACALFIHASLSAQEVFSLGPRVGVNFANVSNVDDSKAATGLVLGLTSTYSISETVGITLDILYSQEGYKIENVSDEVSLDYVQIPLYFDVFFGDLGQSFRPKIYIGLSPGILMKAEVGDLDIKDDTRSLVLDLSGGLGFNYRLSDLIWLNVDLRSFIGLSDVRDQDLVDLQGGDKIAARNVQLSAGIAFGLF